MALLSFVFFVVVFLLLPFVLSLSLSLSFSLCRVYVPKEGGGAVTPKEWRVVPLALRHDDEDGPKMIFSKRKKMK